jgi:GNAT superfamily N-acetyltransferase
MDLYMWSLTSPVASKSTRRSGRWPPKVESEHGIVCRNFRKKDLRGGGRALPRGLQRRLGAQLGLRAADRAEVRHYAKDLKPILDENWAMVAERGHRRGGRRGADAARLQPGAGQAAPARTAAAVRLADRAARARKIDAVRVFALGVKPAYQHTGVAARFYQMHFDAAERTPQKGGEMGWILETNKPMNRAMEGMGGEIKRRYRVLSRRGRIGSRPARGRASGQGGELVQIVGSRSLLVDVHLLGGGDR